MNASREELLEEIYSLNKTINEVKLIINSPVYVCGQKCFDKDCTGIFIENEKYSQLKILLK